MSIKAIETHYKGYRFRSRLEARWAVFFDHAGIKWDYEVEGYELPSGWYLPDFWLPQVNMWAEVKYKPFDEIEIRKCVELSTGTGHPCLLLDGSPKDRNYWGVQELDMEQGFEELGGLKFTAADYLLYTSKDYPETEGRFFTSTGNGYPEIEFNDYFSESSPVLAARQARFEHGENG